jgi:hypothetical protein
MSDLQQYKNKRMKKDPKFWKDYEKRLETFKLGVLLKQEQLVNTFMLLCSNSHLPMQPSASISGKFKQKFFFMTPIRNACPA